jgi:branched-chain amino acid aminotransferase
MESYPSYVNGRVYLDEEPTISAEDLGFLLGLSVYDTLLYEQRSLDFLEDHLARLRRGSEEIGIEWPPPWDPAEALWSTVEALGDRAAAVRITLSRGVPERGATVVVTTRELEIPPDPGIRALVASYHKMSGDPLERVKSTNRLRNILAREQAKEHGAWEAVLAGHEGDLTEATTCNLFVVHRGELLTAPLDRGCLSGIMRGKIIADLEREPLRLEDGTVVPLRIARLDPEIVAGVSEVFLTNTTCRVVPVIELLGADTGGAALPGIAGPVTRAVRARVKALEEAYRASARKT